jgi:hypothetical protein
MQQLSLFCFCMLISLQNCFGAMIEVVEREPRDNLLEILQIRASQQAFVDPYARLYDAVQKGNMADVSAFLKEHFATENKIILKAYHLAVKSQEKDIAKYLKELFIKNRGDEKLLTYTNFLIDVVSIFISGEHSDDGRMVAWGKIDTLKKISLGDVSWNVLLNFAVKFDWDEVVNVLLWRKDLVVFWHGVISMMFLCKSYHVVDLFRQMPMYKGELLKVANANFNSFIIFDGGDPRFFCTFLPEVRDAVLDSALITVQKCGADKMWYAECIQRELARRELESLVIV